MLIFLFQSCLVLSVLYAVYRLTLRHTTLHGLSRAVLLLIMGCSLLLPAFRLSLSDESRVVARFHHLEKCLRLTLSAPSSTTATQHVQGVGLRRGETRGTVAAAPPTVGEAALCLYIMVTCCLLARYLLALMRYARLLRHSRRAFRVGKVRVYTHPGVASPVSWGRTLVLSPDDLRADLLTPVGHAGSGASHRHSPLLRHELAHIRLCHTLDRVVCDVAARLWWFCPVALLWRADLEAVHEYQADSRVVGRGVELEAYSALLVERATSTYPRCAVHGWQASQVKLRLRMLYALHSRPVVAWRALLLLPAVCVLAVCLAVPAEVARVVQPGAAPMQVSRSRADASPSLPVVAPAMEVTTPTAGAPSAPPAAAEASEDAALYISRRLTSMSIAELADDFGLTAETGYNCIVTVDGVGDATAVEYRVDDVPCDAATFARHAAVHFDHEHATLWAFGKEGRQSGLKAVPRDQARLQYGVDAEVLAVYTREAPPARPGKQHTLVAEGSGLYTITIQ